jgi:hypothetical protein
LETAFGRRSALLLFAARDQVPLRMQKKIIETEIQRSTLKPANDAALGTKS